MSRLEICIDQIHFSDALLSKPQRTGGYCSLPHPQPDFAPAILSEAHLAWGRCHRIMHRERKVAVPAGSDKQGEVAAV